MKFSIITTFYNNTIEEIVKLKDSILNQTYSKWEWIISDDFSQDSLSHIEFLKSLPLEDKRIKYINQKSKKEIFWNPQTYATGDIVMLIGADDWISYKSLEIFCYHFVKYPNLLFITSEANIYGDNYEIKSSIFLNYLNFGNALDRIKKSEFHNWLNMGVPLTWRNIPIDFTEGIDINPKSIINDYIIHIRLEELGQFIHLPRVFYHCKIRENSISRKIDENNDHSVDSLKITELAIEKRKNKHLNSHIDIYNNIIEECKVFYYSDFNLEKTCQNVSLITPNNDIDMYKQRKIQELYFDHNLYFNQVDENIDYYFFLIKSNSSLEEFEKFFNKISKCKEISLLILEDSLVEKITPFFGAYWWYKGIFTWIKTNKF